MYLISFSLLTDEETEAQIGYSMWPMGLRQDHIPIMSGQETVPEVLLLNPELLVPGIFIHVFIFPRTGMKAAHIPLD